MPDDFPSELRQFIDRHIESLVQLEMLLLLRQDPERQWNTEQIARELYIPQEMSASLIADLSRRGFTKAGATEAAVSYDTPDPESTQLVDQLASIYQERRVAVISLIYSKPVNKVKTFADAFRLRKES